MGVMIDIELVERCPAAIRRKVTSTLLFVLLSISAGGCSESDWVIPYPPGGTPSKLWSDDPRTRGWEGVVVFYSIDAYGHVDAKIVSADRRHRFAARGEFWNENQQGEKFRAYKGEDLTPILAVRFGEKEERYIAGYDYSGHGRSLKLYEPAAHDEKPRHPSTTPAAGLPGPGG